VKGWSNCMVARSVPTATGPGKGSRFTVKLPLVERAVAADGPAQPSDAASKGCRKVLIIEDNKDAADSLSEVLGLSGHRVAVAYDGAAGLVMAREFRPENHHFATSGFQATWTGMR